MKCVCGYKYDEYHESKSQASSSLTKMDFIKDSDNGTVAFFKADMTVSYTYGKYYTPVKKPIYICPVCGTLRVDL